MTEIEQAQAALFAQLQPHVLSRQEALLFGTNKDDYFQTRDAILAAWHRDPTKYLSFAQLEKGTALLGQDTDLAWRTFAFLVKNGYINAGLVHARETQQLMANGSTHSGRVRPVCNVPVCSSFVHSTISACGVCPQAERRPCRLCLPNMHAMALVSNYNVP